MGAAGAVGISYWKNLQLVRTAEAATDSWRRDASEELTRDVIDDPDLAPVLPLLNKIANMPAGYGDSQNASIWEGFGLGQRDRLNRVATDTYAGALERMMRPRLILDLERRMPGIIASGVYPLAATLQSEADFGRILAAYGGVFIAAAFIWGAVFDGFKPDRFDIAGAMVCLGGVSLIMFAPRGA